MSSKKLKIFIFTSWLFLSLILNTVMGIEGKGIYESTEPIEYEMGSNEEIYEIENEEEIKKAIEEYEKNKIQEVEKIDKQEYPYIKFCKCTDKYMVFSFYVGQLVNPVLKIPTKRYKLKIKPVFYNNEAISECLHIYDRINEVEEEKIEISDDVNFYETQNGAIIGKEYEDSEYKEDYLNFPILSLKRIPLYVRVPRDKYGINIKEKDFKDKGFVASLTICDRDNVGENEKIKIELRDDLYKKYRRNSKFEKYEKYGIGRENYSVRLRIDQQALNEGNTIVHINEKNEVSEVTEKEFLNDILSQISNVLNYENNYDVENKREFLIDLNFLNAQNIKKLSELFDELEFYLK